MSRHPSVTCEDILRKGHTFFVTFSRPPERGELFTHDFPHPKTITKFFGTFERFQGLVRDGVTRLADITRRCLKCERTFFPAPDDARVCDVCKDADDWRETVDWLCGEIVTPMSLYRGRVNGLRFEREEPLYGE